MLRIAIIGCGKIADSHASQIGRIADCEIVGVYDREPLMAQQLAARFPIKRAFTRLTDLFDDASPDVVHITTPPQGHFDLAKTCLDRGCHVYVEKPFTVWADEAEKLIALAREKQLKLTVGHDDQFSHVARRMRSAVGSGYLGGPPVHMESNYSYEIAKTGYAGALLSDKQHWVRRLPGKLAQNIISHGIARIAEYMVGDSPGVITYGFTSPTLQAYGETEIVDEIRVIVHYIENTTAYFTFSSQIRPGLHGFRIYGPKNGLLLDQDQETLIKLRGARYKSYAEKFVPPISIAGEYLRNVSTNLRTFLRNDFHMKSGLKFLIEAFYRSIVEGTPEPIPYREILLTSRIMESIFNSLNDEAIERRSLSQEAHSVAAV